MLFKTCTHPAQSCQEEEVNKEPLYHTETLTCPGGSLRNSDEVASDLARSEVDVCETHFMIATICHSEGRQRETVRHTQTHTSFTSR